MGERGLASSNKYQISFLLGDRDDPDTLKKAH